MLSLSAVSAQAGMSYYEKEDYYFKDQAGEVVLGREQYGEKISKEQFENLVQERIQQTGGDVEGKNKVAEDLTFSAPKSVSLVAALDKDQRENIFKAHQEAVQKTMEYIQQSGMIQTREKGKPVRAENIVAVRFDHFTSRNGDPQLHSHTLILNRVRDTNGELRATYLREIYQNKIALGTLYRQELASNLKKIGYEVKWNKDGTFEIAGFTREQLEKFSSRRKEIVNAMKERGLEGGKAAEVAALDTRHAKQEYDIHKLEQTWQKTAKEVGIEIPKPELKEQQKTKIEEKIRAVDVKNLVEEATQKQIETAGFTQVHRVELDVAKVLAKDGITANIDQIKSYAQEGIKYMQQRDQGAIMLGKDHVGREYITTSDVLNAELRSREEPQQERLGLDKQKTQEILNKFNENLQKTKGFQLDQYQTQAVEKISTSNRDGIIVGKAGAGKTRIMEAFREAYKQQGKAVIGAAPTGAAAYNLEKEAGIKSYTIDSLCFQEQKMDKAQLKGGLLIVDEAGMLDAKRDAAISEFAEKHEMKILRVGDPDQIKPVGHGDPFAQKIQEEQEKGGQNLVVLDKIYRQKEEKYRDVTLKAAIGKTVESLEQAKKNGWVKEITARGERIQAAAKEYLEDRKNGKNTLLVTESNALKNRLNKEIRYTLQKEGVLDKDGIKIETRGTDGKKTGEKEFVRGDVIQFLRNDKQIGIMNGQIGQIQKIDAQKNIMSVKVGDEIKKLNYKKYNYLDHGYATTIHKSQGQTVDRVIYLHDTKKSSSMTTQNLYYVAISRGREGMTIYTDNFAKMKEKVSQAQQKKDVLIWQAKNVTGKSEDKDIKKEDLKNTVDKEKYAQFSAQEKIKDGIIESAARQTWYDMNKQEKHAVIRYFSDSPNKDNRDNKEIKNKIEEKTQKAWQKSAEWYPSTNAGKQETQRIEKQTQRNIIRSFSYLVAGKYFNKKYFESIAQNKGFGRQFFWGTLADKGLEDIWKDRKAFRLAKEDKGLIKIALRHGLDVAGRVKTIRKAYAVKSENVKQAFKYGGIEAALDATIHKIAHKIRYSIFDSKERNKYQKGRKQTPGRQKKEKEFEKLQEKIIQSIEREERQKERQKEEKKTQIYNPPKNLPTNNLNKDKSKKEEEEKKEKEKQQEISR